MKDLQKIKEFFSKPLKEERDIYDEIANEEFGMDYDQLGPNEKEWVRDEVSNMNESKKETGVDMAKKRLDQLGVKYEMSKTDKVRPFKVIYKPINKSDKFYDEFEDIVDLFNLKGFVKSSMDEAKFMSGILSGKDFINAKLKNYPKAVAKVNQLINMIGEDKFTIEIAEWIFDFFNNAHFESPMNEAQEQSLYKNWDQFEKPSKIKVYLNSGKTLEISPLKLKGGKRVYDAILQAFIDDRFDITNKVIQGMTNNLSEAKEEDVVDTITMDVPLFIRMLEYSREDANEDMDLHDVTEKAIALGKERGILSMEDYEEIVGAAEEIKEVNLKASKLSSSEYQKAKKLKDFKASDWKWNADEDLYTKVNEGELTEAYVPSNIREFAKRRGVSSLVNKVAGWAEKVGKGIRGGTAIGKDYSTLILDMTYQGSEIRINTDNDTITLYDEPVRSFNDFQRIYADGEGNNLEEGMGGEIDEKYFVKVSSKDARKAIGTYDEYRDNFDIKKYDDTLYASNTPSDIYDFYYDLSSQDIEIEDWNIGEDEDDENAFDSEYEKTLKETIKFIKENNPKATSEEVIAELKEIKRLGEQLNEELCPAGKAYIKRRQAAGEKSSAYLSGRGVKVCKGQMSGRKKKK